MNELEYLRKVWGEDNSDNSSRDIASNEEYLLVKKLKHLEKFQNSINRIKLIVVIILISSIILTSYISGLTSLILYSGLFVVVLSTLIFMIYYFRNQFNSSKLDYSLDSITFAKDAIGKLKRQNRIFRTPFVLFIICMIIGSNLILYGINSGFNVNETLLFHIVYSLFIASFGYIGIMIRKWRIKKEVTPIINELKKIENGNN